MDRTPNLDIPYILPSQAQKHVTHNEAIRALDAVVQLSVVKRNLMAPPSKPEEGDRYILPGGATGGWSGHKNKIAAWQDGAWAFYPPQSGWTAWIRDEKVLVNWDGSSWRISGGSKGEFNTVSVGGAGADTTNRIASNAAATLLNHAGKGHQLKINKKAAGDTGSVLFQTGFSGRAEFGLTGDDDWHVKVSPDGSAWKEALTVNKDNGEVRFPAGIVHPDSGKKGRLYIPSTVKEAWRIDASRTATPRTYAVASVSGTSLNLSTSTVATIFTPGMRDVARVRIWNTTRNESAWVDYDMSSTQLRVTNAADISSWANGDALRLGDPNPTGANALNMVAVDIGNYLYNQLGAVFRQEAVALGLYVSSTNGSCGLGFSADGAVGSAFDAYALSDGGRNTMSFVVPTNVKSPISDSNLLFLRETLGGSATDLTIVFARILGVFV